MITKADILKVTGGKALGEDTTQAKLVVSGVQFDSRTVRGGELFVAMKGEKSDGNAFARMAYDKGASLILADNAELLKDFPEPSRVVIVSDSLVAFQKLAAFWRETVRTPVIAVTGSVGKTTTKEMLACILSGRGPGAYSIKSYNNHVGVPVTVLGMSPQHEWAALEMGMNHAGELSVLSQIGRPNVAIITTVAAVHLEFFKDLSGVADAKLEILDGLKPGGVLIVNGDNQLIESGLERRLPGRSIIIKRFGQKAGVEAQVLEITSSGLQGISFTLRLLGKSHQVKMKVLGKVNAYNAAAAALGAATLFPDMPHEDIVAGLTRFTAPLMRLHILKLADGRQILDDSYNANPVAMKSILEIAAEIGSAGKKIGLVLGGMKELGADSAELHRSLAGAVAAVNPTFLAIKGEFSEGYAELLPKNTPVFTITDDAEGARQILKQSFDMLCVKGSRGVGLDRIVSALNPAQTQPIQEKSN